MSLIVHPSVNGGYGIAHVCPGDDCAIQHWDLGGRPSQAIEATKAFDRMDDHLRDIQKKYDAAVNLIVTLRSKLNDAEAEVPPLRCHDHPDLLLKR